MVHDSFTEAKRLRHGKRESRNRRGTPKRESRNRRGTPKKERLQIRKAVNCITVKITRQKFHTFFFGCKSYKQNHASCRPTTKIKANSRSKATFFSGSRKIAFLSRVDWTLWPGGYALRLSWRLRTHSGKCTRDPSSGCVFWQDMPSYTWMQGNYNLLNRRDAQLALPAQKWPPAVKQYSCHSINK